MWKKFYVKVDSIYPAIKVLDIEKRVFAKIIHFPRFAI